MNVVVKRKQVETAIESVEIQDGKYKVVLSRTSNNYYKLKVLTTSNECSFVMHTDILEGFLLGVKEFLEEEDR